MRILVVDDDEITAEIIENILRAERYEIQTARNGREALKIFEAFSPELVITDIEMPEMNGLQLLAAIRKVNSETIVVVATAHGSEEYTVQALHAQANDYLRKPIDHNLLLFLVHKYAAALEARIKGNVVSQFITQSEMSLTFGNRLDLIYDIVEYLISQASSLLPANDLPMLRFGLAELITNAIEHGNLGITHEIKSELLEKAHGHSELIAQRLADPCYGRRRVTVKSKIDKNACEWVIMDEGEGFDWRGLPAEFTAESLFSSHGRGVILSRLQFDEMEYLDKGNCVRVKRYAKRPFEQPVVAA